MQIVARPHDMPENLPSPADVARARAFCSEQRVKLGLNPNPDAPPLELSEIDARVLLGDGYSLEHRIACAGAVDALVETFGLDLVLHCVHAVAAMNGRAL